MKTSRKLKTYRREPCNSGKLKATASPRGGVESSWKRDPQSVTQVNLIRPNYPASLRVNGEAKFWENRKVDDLTSHGNGVRRREDMKTRWLRTECEIRVCANHEVGSALAPLGALSCVSGETCRSSSRCGMEQEPSRAQASQGKKKHGGAPSTLERRRVTIAGAKDGRKENPWKR